MRNIDACLYVRPSDRIRLSAIIGLLSAFRRNPCPLCVGFRSTTENQPIRGSQSAIWVCGKDTSLFVAKSAFRDQVAGLLVPLYGLRGEVVLRERLLSHRDLIHDPRDRCRRGMAHQLYETRILA